MSGSALTAQSLEPALDSVPPCLSAPPPLTRSQSLSLNKQTKQTLKKQKQNKPFPAVPGLEFGQGTRDQVDTKATVTGGFSIERGWQALRDLAAGFTQGVSFRPNSNKNRQQW